MRTQTRSPTLCASPSRDCANGSANPGSSRPCPASATASITEQTVDRAPGLSVRLKLTLSYAAFLMLAGVVLLAAGYFSLSRGVHPGVIFIVQSHGDLLHDVTTRAIDLTEALLLLSRADQRSFTREHVDLSLVAEEAAETLLPLAEKRGLTIETSGDMTLTVGSHVLLLQLSTNLVHNAIVHNLPEQGTVWVTTSAHPKSAVLTVENTGEKLTPELVSTLAEPFLRGTKRIRPDHAGAGVGLGLA